MKLGYLVSSGIVFPGIIDDRVFNLNGIIWWGPMVAISDAEVGKIFPIASSASILMFSMIGVILIWEN